MSPLHALGWKYLNFLPKIAEVPLEWRGRMVLGPGRILFCFPEDYDLFLKGWNIIQEVGLDRSRIVIVARRPFLHVLGKKGAEKRVAYELNDISRWGLAKKNLIRRVKKTRPTMAVDLHTSSIPLGGHLCLRSGAKVRAGLQEKGGARVFNFLLQSSVASSYEDRVYALFTYLGLAGQDDKVLETGVSAVVSRDA